MMTNEISEAQNIICLPVSTMRVLLDHFNWDSQALMNSYFTNEKLTFEKAKCPDPDAVIAVGEESLKICDICLDDLDKTSMTHDPCGHTCCHSCWLDYLKQSIVTEGKSLRLECPMSTCFVFLDDNFVKNICREFKPVLDTYWTLLATRYVEEKETLSLCPKSKCGNEFCFESSRPYLDPLPYMSLEERKAEAFKKYTGQL